MIIVLQSIHFCPSVESFAVPIISEMNALSFFLFRFYFPAKIALIINFLIYFPILDMVLLYF